MGRNAKGTRVADARTHVGGGDGGRRRRRRARRTRGGARECDFSRRAIGDAEDSGESAGRNRAIAFERDMRGDHHEWTRNRAEGKIGGVRRVRVRRREKYSRRWRGGARGKGGETVRVDISRGVRASGGGTGGGGARGGFVEGGRARRARRGTARGVDLGRAIDAGRWTRRRTIARVHDDRCVF